MKGSSTLLTADQGSEPVTASKRVHSFQQPNHWAVLTNNPLERVLWQDGDRLLAKLTDILPAPLLAIIWHLGTDIYIYKPESLLERYHSQASFLTGKHFKNTWKSNWMMLLSYPTVYSYKKLPQTLLQDLHVTNILQSLYTDA